MFQFHYTPPSAPIPGEPLLPDEVYTIAYYTLVIAAYVLKIAVVRCRVCPKVAYLLFLLGISLTLPLIYRFDPNWQNRFMWSHLLIYVGDPLLIYTVPFASLVFDLHTRHRTRSHSIWPFHILRATLEIVVLITVWEIAWSWLMLLFGWIWI